MSPTLHHPVLLDAAISWLNPRDGGLYVDATLGVGGHSRAILERSAPGGRVIGLDRDLNAVKAAQENLASFGGRVQICHRPFAEMSAVLTERGISRVDGVLFDLGISSLHVDRAERGFSFMKDGPLDMRMDSCGALTAADIVNNAPEEKLADIFFHYGGERRARRVAAAIVQTRTHCPLRTTRELAALVEKTVAGPWGKKYIHPATRVFQGLRIAVNDELTQIEQGLAAATAVLRPGGRLCVISFHSLEDRMVKKTMADKRHFTVLTKKPMEPTPEECRSNRRARSARLRVADKCGAGDLHALPSFTQEEQGTEIA